jgi:hypothetical protein
MTYIPGSSFSGCSSLRKIIIPKGVTNIENFAFAECLNLGSYYFLGNAPTLGISAMGWNSLSTVYYLPGTTGWGSGFAGRNAILWNPQVKMNESTFGVVSNRFGFSITGDSRLVFLVEATTNLNNPVWVPLTNYYMGRGFYFGDPQWTNHPARFYRIRSP